MPACSRDTEGWLRSNSQIGRRPISRPSATIVTLSTCRSSRAMMKVASMREMRVRSPPVREGNLVNWPSLTVGLLTLPHFKEHNLHNVNHHQRQHHRGRNHMWRDPDLQQAMKIDERLDAAQRG